MCDLARMREALGYVDGMGPNILQRRAYSFLNPYMRGACYLYLCKAEEGGDVVASLTDDNAAMMQIASLCI